MRGETVITDIHAVKSAEILDITRIERMVLSRSVLLLKKHALLKTGKETFCQEIPDKITIMNDVWTFGRDIKAKDRHGFI